MSLPADIEHALAARFLADAPRARALVEPLLAFTDGARVIRCVLHLGTDLERLAHFSDAARSDPRDVMWWAEYDGGERQLRDFSQPLA